MEHNNCIFCDRKNFEDRIIFEDERFYIIASVGQLDDNGGYVLIVPKEHTPCIAAMGDQNILFMSRLEDILIPAMTKEYDVQPMIFEHGIVGQSIKHAHLHLIPGNFSLTKIVCKDFPGNEIKAIESLTMLAHYYRKKQHLPYLLWSEPNDNFRVCWNPAAWSKYFRIIGAKLKGNPERADWENLSDKLHDKWLIRDTISRLQPYF